LGRIENLLLARRFAWCLPVSILVNIRPSATLIFVLHCSLFSTPERTMKRQFLVLCILLLPLTAGADRITQMSPVDLCTYSAKMQVAGYYYFEQGKSRDEVVVKWHGDETQNEIDFINRMLDEAYAWLTTARRSDSKLIPVLTFGDMVYQACMNGKPL
jgi:hypothetical protein